MQFVIKLCYIEKHDPPGINAAVTNKWDSYLKMLALKMAKMYGACEIYFDYKIHGWTFKVNTKRSFSENVSAHNNYNAKYETT